VRARRISKDGPLAGAVVSLEDVTDELRTERILAWGEMARQVAHEVKNPLTPIKLSVQHLRRAWDDRRPDFGDILTRNAEAMLGEIDRLAAIASSFSRFGAPRAVGEEPLAPVDLERVVREVLTLYDQGEGAVHFTADVAPGLPSVAARVSELKEVLVNLLENSRAAVKAGGEVRVEAREMPAGVVLAVVDDGAGIPNALQARVFEPHFSTRSSGTGLGLAIVHRLVGSWGAGIDLVSQEDRGTTVSILFPRSDGGGPSGADPTSFE
jgi:two-component system nitrogen regulation sensor histidine kinase NtrY